MSAAATRRSRGRQGPLLYDTLGWLEVIEAACQEWKAWDADGRDWDSTFDSKHVELCERHTVSALIDDVAFEIVPVGVYPGGVA